MHKIIVDDSVYETDVTKKFERRKVFIPKSNKQVKAFIPGTIKEVCVKKGQTVAKGEKLLILEAMKMLNVVKAETDGKVKSIRVEPEDKVIKAQLLLELE